MQTSFTAEQLADPKITTANAILRKCVHCGFCTATCPTYELLGDALGLKPIAALFDLVPAAAPASEDIGGPGTYPAARPRRARVALLRGCVQSVLDQAINAAAIRLLNRHG